MHPPIVEPELFEAVQTRLAANRQQRAVRRDRVARAPLTGRIFDVDGQPWRVDHHDLLGAELRIRFDGDARIFRGRPDPYCDDGGAAGDLPRAEQQHQPAALNQRAPLHCNSSWPRGVCALSVT